MDTRVPIEYRATARHADKTSGMDMCQGHTATYPATDVTNNQFDIKGDVLKCRSATRCKYTLEATKNIKTAHDWHKQIGRASCRERVYLFV